MISLPTSRRRRGNSLLEILIVMAVLSAMAAITWPAMRGPLGKARLQEAAKQVRVELLKTRLKAIEDGITYEFRYQLGSDRFQVAPRSLPGDGSDLASREDASKRDAIALQLPEGVFFAPEGDHATDDVLPRGDDQAWSPPIVFHPNGRSANARITLLGQRDFEIDVALRGLTGTAKIGRRRNLGKSP